MTATGDTYSNGYAASRERFERDTAEHEMTILRDDGVYRHVRFMRPGDSFYRYDLVTWPGYLAIVGDCEDYVFSRLEDMFQFFASGPGINPHYWSEKLQAPRHNAARAFTERALRARVAEWFEQATDGACDDLSPSDMRALSSALEADIMREGDWGAPPDERTAFVRLHEFEFRASTGKVVRIYEPGEWDLREWCGHFLWACWAIRRGVQRYRAATAAV